jgi:hypothetical protein
MMFPLTLKDAKAFGSVVLMSMPFIAIDGPSYGGDGQIFRIVSLLRYSRKQRVAGFWCDFNLMDDWRGNMRE